MFTAWRFNDLGISRGDVKPQISWPKAVYDISFIINPFWGMYQKIHPLRAIGCSVKINTSLVMMRECKCKMQWTVNTNPTLEMIVLAGQRGGRGGSYLWLQANIANASCSSPPNWVSGYCHWSNCWSNYLDDLTSSQKQHFSKIPKPLFLQISLNTFLVCQFLWNMRRCQCDRNLTNLLQALSAVRGFCGEQEILQGSRVFH